MSKTARLIIVGILLLFAVGASACMPGPQAGQAQESGPVAAEEVAGPGLEDVDEGEEAEPGEEGEASSAEAGNEIPVMENAYRLQVSRSGENVMYQVDASMDEVVTFYQSELERRGWETARVGDSLMGSRASMLREREDKRLTVSLQENPVGGFVTVNISVVKK